MSIDGDTFEPAAVAAELRDTVDQATGHLLRTAARLTDEQAREPSLLPGWSRGHVLTHIARNADGLRNLLIWARTGVVTPQYADEGERERGIVAGAGRSAADLLADLDGSAAAFAAEADRLHPGAWAAEVHGRRGPAHPAWFTLQRRLSEVEIHHVDLDAGYGADDWPTLFAVTSLKRIAADFADDETPPARLVSPEAGLAVQIGPPEAAPLVEVSGPTWALLAWLVGRTSGAGLTTTPPGQLPALPPW
ncbi:MAG TPA: maleylpyruvate isomerase family mycothiol-dependent enzyme [Streptosporangiaceae bacterium]|nr:maleylpyruvate isomerase family mycothiol-dependent enzyme [Streptosporangiaceae bacterium]